jgi:uncharacterized membrane protein
MTVAPFKKAFDLDLSVVLGVTGVVLVAVFIPYVNQTLFRSLTGRIFIIVVPGYSPVASLFAGKNDISGMGRAALSFGLSIVIVPLAGLILNFTSWGIRLEPMLGTLALSVIAVYQLRNIAEKRSHLINVSLFVLMQN